MANPPDQSQFDAAQATRFAFSDSTGTLKVMSGFLMQELNREIDVAYPSSTTETYTYKNGSGTTLFVLTVTYTDSTKSSLSSVKRTT